MLLLVTRRIEDFMPEKASDLIQGTLARIIHEKWSGV